MYRLSWHRIRLFFLVLECFVGGADRAFRCASSTLTHVLQNCDSRHKSFLTLGVQEARAVIRARACARCVYLCVQLSESRPSVRLPQLGRAQPTPVPRVIPVIIAPFGVGAGVQLLIWSFYNELFSLGSLQMMPPCAAPTPALLCKPAPRSLLCPGW